MSRNSFNRNETEASRQESAHARRLNEIHKPRNPAQEGIDAVKKDDDADYEKKAAAAFYANKPMDEVQAHLNRGWTAHEEKMAKTDNGKGFKSLKHKSEVTSGKDTYHREDGYPSTEKLR